MKELLTIGLGANGTATIDCPAGKELRILAVNFEFTGIANGDQALVSFLSRDQTVLTTGSEGLAAGSLAACAFIGAGTTLPLAVSQTVATGVINYTNPPTIVTMPLADVWFDTALAIEPSVSGAGSVTVNVGLVLYERRDGKSG